MERFSGYNIPRELVEQILVNLPVKSLVRFKSVCKLWNSIINDPKFVNDHRKIAFSSSNSSKLSMILGYDYNEISMNEIILSGDNSIISPLDLLPSFETKNERGAEYRKLISLCNGVLCLVHFKLLEKPHCAVFYNPALREHKSIYTNRKNYGSCDFGGFGFGYDSKSDDYKFVWTTRITRLYKDRWKRSAIGDVYSLRTDRWTEIDIETYREPALPMGSYMKGRCYWLTWSDCIFSFDFSDEKFRLIDRRPQRRRLGYSSSISKILTMPNESQLVYIEQYIPRDQSQPMCFDIWVMEIDDDHHRDAMWTKHHTISGDSATLMGFLPEPPNFRSPRCTGFMCEFLNNGELFMHNNSGQFVTYNLSTGRVLNVALSNGTLNPIQGSHNKTATYAILFKESLVSVNRLKKNITQP